MSDNCCRVISTLHALINHENYDELITVNRHLIRRLVERAYGSCKFDCEHMSWVIEE